MLPCISSTSLRVRARPTPAFDTTGLGTQAIERHKEIIDFFRRNTYASIFYVDTQRVLSLGAAQ